MRGNAIVFSGIGRELYDYHLIRSMQNIFTGIWFDSFLADKAARYFWDRKYNLPERWKSILTERQYFDFYTLATCCYRV